MCGGGGACGTLTVVSPVTVKPESMQTLPLLRLAQKLLLFAVYTAPTTVLNVTPLTPPPLAALRICTIAVPGSPGYSEVVPPTAFADTL